jgi:tetratricopeptide (TPR) repeat protein
MSSLGLTERALRPQTEALEIYQRLLPADDPKTLWSLGAMATVQFNRFQFVEAEAYARAALAGQRRVLGTDHPTAIQSTFWIGWALQRQERYEEAERCQLEALAMLRRVRGDRHPETIGPMVTLGQLMMFQQRYSEAEQYLQEALELLRGAPTTDETLMRAWLVLANVRRGQGRFGEAVPLLAQSLEGGRQAYGDDHRETIFLHGVLGEALTSENRLDEAEVHLRAYLEGSRRIWHGHPDVFDAEESMGRLCARQGRLGEAAAHFRRALEGYSRVSGEGEGGASTLHITRQLATVLLRNGQADQAQAVCQDQVAAWRAAYGTTHTQTLDAVRGLGSNIHRNAKRAWSQRESRVWIDGYRGRSDLPETCQMYALDTVATIFRDAGCPEEALPLYEEEQRLHAGAGGALDQREPAIWIRHAECLIMLQRFADAERELLECRDSLAADDPAFEAAAAAIDAALAKLHAARDTAQPSPTGRSDHP